MFWNRRKNNPELDKAIAERQKSERRLERTKKAVGELKVVREENHIAEALRNILTDGGGN